MRTVALLMTLAILPLSAERSGPTRDDLQTIEKMSDSMIRGYSVEAPFEVMGVTRGVYLENYGAVFLVETSLVQTPLLGPFVQERSKALITRIHDAKLKRVGMMEELMKDVMLASAKSLDRLPPEQNLVLGMSFFYNNWEDRNGLPRVITMQAKRKDLLEVALAHAPRTQLATAISVREE